MGAIVRSYALKFFQLLEILRDLYLENPLEFYFNTETVRAI